MSRFEPPLLAASVFDRAAHRRTDPEWLAEAWTRAKVVQVSPRSTTPASLLDSGRHVQLGASSELGEVGERLFLGEHDGVPYFAVAGADHEGWAGIRELGPEADALELDLLVTAVALLQWHQRHTHCPLCGTPTELDQAGWTRRCPADDSQHFPRTDPAVIMLIHDGAGRCLLGRGAAWGVGRYSTLAGFVEPGESLEAAVIREVYEEVNVVVSDVDYVASQPWPFPASLMLGFFGRADSSLPLQADGVEMLAAGWFTRDQVSRAATWTDLAAPLEGGDDDADVLLKAIPPRLSISRYLIDRWLSGDGEL